jgi:hypothetical protein
VYHRTQAGWTSARIIGTALCLLLTVNAWATESVDTLAARLTDHTDFRVRTQAALALGSSGEARAVDPLCKGLSDPNASVRSACAAALGKLKLGGQACLRACLADEAAGAVRKACSRSLGVLEEERVQSRLTATTRYYVAIGTTSDSSGRSGKEVDQMVRAAMAEALWAREGYVVAPEAETPAQSKKRLAKFTRIKGVFLAPSVKPIEYTGSSLSVRVELAIFTYPTKVLRGMLPVKLTQTGVREKERSSEDGLIRAAAERAAVKLSENIGRI